jgi:hypothetical protein
VLVVVVAVVTVLLELQIQVAVVAEQQLLVRLLQAAQAAPALLS